MIRAVVARVAWAIVVIWIVATAVFFVNDVLPSDAARMIAGPQARPAEIIRVRRELGLDRPMFARYRSFMGRLVHIGPAKDASHGSCIHVGWVHIDLGKSYQERRPVVSILGDRLPATLWLAWAALTTQFVLGAALGILAAVKRRTVADAITVGVSLLFASAPTFVLGLGLQFLFGYQFRILPIDDYGRSTWEHAVHVILPALTLGLFGAASYTRLVRDAVAGEISHDYVRTARAKGAGAARVLVLHALRNALLPIVAVLGLDIGSLAGGAVVTETLFRWPGLGALSVNALLDRDGPVLMGVVLVGSIAVATANLCADMVSLWLDPRATSPAAHDTP